MQQQDQHRQHPHLKSGVLAAAELVKGSQKCWLDREPKACHGVRRQGQLDAIGWQLQRLQITQLVKPILLILSEHQRAHGYQLDDFHRPDRNLSIHHLGPINMAARSCRWRAEFTAYALASQSFLAGRACQEFYYEFYNEPVSNRRPILKPQALAGKARDHRCTAGVNQKVSMESD
jgi:hypothetical protein